MQKLLVVLSVGLVVLIVFGKLSSSSGGGAGLDNIIGIQRQAEPKSEARDRCIDDYMAFRAAQKALRPHLKAPDQAEFLSGSSDYVVTRMENCEFMVAGKVMAMNSFGVKLKKTYTAHVRPRGEREWDILDVRLED